MATFSYHIAARNADGTPHRATEAILEMHRVGRVTPFSRRLPDGTFDFDVGRVIAVREEEGPRPLVTVEEVSAEEKERYWSARNRYRLTLLDSAGTRPGGVLATKRTFDIGNLVNLPEGPDGPPSRSPTKGHTWRVVAIEDADLLSLEYLRPWREGDPRCCG